MHDIVQKNKVMTERGVNGQGQTGRGKKKVEGVYNDTSENDLLHVGRVVFFDVRRRKKSCDSVEDEVKERKGKVAQAIILPRQSL